MAWTFAFPLVFVIMGMLWLWEERGNLYEALRWKRQIKKLNGQQRKHQREIEKELGIEPDEKRLGKEKRLFRNPPTNWCVLLFRISKNQCTI
jgi:hypothetical protein